MKKKLLIIIPVIIVLIAAIVAVVFITRDDSTDDSTTTTNNAQITETENNKPEGTEVDLNEVDEFTLNLLNNGYDVYSMATEEDNDDSDEFFGLEPGSFECQIVAINDNDCVYIYCCNTEEAAKKVYETTEELHNSADPEDVADFSFYRDGDTVYLGTENGLTAMESSDNGYINAENDALKLLDKGYVVSVMSTKEDNDSSDTFFELDAGSFKAQIIAVNDEDSLYIYYCGTEEAAKKVYETTEELHNSADPEDVAEFSFYRDGDTVYLGTEKALADIK